MPHRWFPAVTAPGGLSNGLLAALPATDLDFLRPELAMVALDQDAVLSRAGEPIEYVFFPHGGAIFFVIDMAGGETGVPAPDGRGGGGSIHPVPRPAPPAPTPVVPPARPPPPRPSVRR